MLFLSLRACIRIGEVSLALLGLSICTVQCAADQSAPISQSRINELAASLLRAHHALIEDPGLRLPGEQIGAYMSRITEPLAHESAAHYGAREEAYVRALESACDPRLLITALPRLQDTSRSNVQMWTKAVHASALLGPRVARVRGAWIALRTEPGRHSNTARLGPCLTDAMLVLKSAFEALREARP